MLAVTALAATACSEDGELQTPEPAGDTQSVSLESASSEAVAAASGDVNQTSGSSSYPTPSTGEGRNTESGNESTSDVANTGAETHSVAVTSSTLEDAESAASTGDPGVSWEDTESASTTVAPGSSAGDTLGDSATSNRGESTGQGESGSAPGDETSSVGCAESVGGTSDVDGSVGHTHSSDAVCGNGEREQPEACDDGNRQGGDGCDSNCQIEAGWLCSTDPQSCDAACGDALLLGDETEAGRCDDGNPVSGDGCSEACRVEEGYVCGGESYGCFASCGDGEIQAPEICDDGNAAPGDGCFACALEPGATCTSSITAKRVCAEDGDVWALDLCGNPVERVTECAGDCAEGACRCVIRVDGEGNDDNTGATWAEAKGSIQAALDAAEADGCEVWVREGTYQPWGNADELFDRTASFHARAGVALYGGFHGTESRRAERDWQTFPTTLFGGQTTMETEPGSTSTVVREGVYHIVVAAADSLIDGFVVAGGNATDRDNLTRCGGAWFSSGGSHRVNNVLFQDNLGVAACATAGAQVTFEGCQFDANQGVNRTRSSAGFGRALLARDSYVSVSNSTFSNHVGGENGHEFGGAVAALGGTLLVQGSWFENNSTLNHGGSLFCGACQLVVRDSRFAENTGGSNHQSDIGGGALGAALGSTLLIVDSLFEGNTGGRPGGAIAVLDSSLTVHNSRFVDNTTPTRVGFGGALAAVGSEVNVTGCLFDGNLSGEPTDVAGGGAVALAGGSGHFVNNTFVNNSAAPTSFLGGGALLLYSSATAHVRNSVFWNNTSEDGDDVYVQTGSSLILESTTFGSETACLPSELECPALDPNFVDMLGGDFTPTNPACIDTGNTAALSADTGDLDQDGDTLEVLPLDILGNHRVQGGSVDLGAIEAR